jgi:hypothetical protein
LERNFFDSKAAMVRITVLRDRDVSRTKVPNDGQHTPVWFARLAKTSRINFSELLQFGASRIAFM